MKKKTFALFLALALVLGAGIGAVAATGSEAISAMLSYETKVIYNGVEQSFVDAKGNPVYPVLYNGTTYLPLRAVSNMMGESRIDYDAATKTVTLGATEKQPTAVTTLKNSGATKYNWVINDKSELSIVGSDATQLYQTGIQFKIWNGGSSTGDLAAMYSEVTGYSSVTFSAWTDSDATVKLFDQDNNIITSFENKAGAIVSKTIDLPAGTTKLSFGADGKAGSKGVLKILDPIVK